MCEFNFKYLAFIALSILTLAPLQAKDPVPENAFDADFSIAKVLDREGMAQFKPAGASRWSLASIHTKLNKGNWIKTGLRGANALKIQLKSGVEFILGPGSLVEVQGPLSISVFNGEVGISIPKDQEFKVTQPNGNPLTLKRDPKQKAWATVRADNGSLEVLKKEPRWLSDYNSNQSTEALGSLLAKIDGREVPLSMESHSVTVDIRDRIARTVIEEVFVNHTHEALEGVFYFPLPADASISGFAIWIGGEMVEADIVEKQRARQIYETLMKEKKDPGLLEWTTGNLFKARVYPIHSSKRIKITYTQALKGSAEEFKYNYALRSELLTLQPLNKLEINVTVSGKDLIDEVLCPTHATRIRKAQRTASVEFVAEEYVPQEDFELVIKTQPSAEGMTFVPHRRDDDGYFILRVDGPEANPKKNEQDNDPLRILILADTSGSMDGPHRNQQLAFIEAFIASLSPEDRFNLATCDTEIRWAFSQDQAGGDAGAEEALSFLQARPPLGWSHIEDAIRSSLDRASKNTQIIYIGDGIPTSAVGDSADFASRLRAIDAQGATFHTVTPGNQSEPLVLDALTSLGSGSKLAITDGDDPAFIANKLLGEITQPALENLELRVDGLMTAAIYPEKFPRLLAGQQLVVVGRYDPVGGPIEGTISVTGKTHTGRAIERVLGVSVKDVGIESSFIPRLWARHHLDHLQTQGASQEIQQRIIDLSEDFQIMTPYTSLLVIEDEEERERFKLEKRLKMRDGEEFFTKGKEDAAYELGRQEALAARLWRIQLRQQVIADLRSLGRSDTLPWDYQPHNEMDFGGQFFSGAVGGGAAGGFGGRWGIDSFAAEKKYAKMPMSSARSSSGRRDRMREMESTLDLADVKLASSNDALGFSFGEDFEGELDFAEEELASPIEGNYKGLRSNANYLYDEINGLSQMRGAYQQAQGQSYRGGRMANRGLVAKGKSLARLSKRESRSYYDHHTHNNPLSDVFPNLTIKNLTRKDPKWGEKIDALLNTLNRSSVLSQSNLIIETTHEHFDVRGKKTRNRTAKSLLSASKWWQKSAHHLGEGYRVESFDSNHRRLVKRETSLGRIREKIKGDETAWSSPIPRYFRNPTRGYNTLNYQVELVENEGKVVGIKIVSNFPKSSVTEFKIDPVQNRITEEIQSDYKGKLQSKVSYTNPIEVAGTWWPTVITWSNKDSKVTQKWQLKISSPNAEEYEKQFTEHQARLSDALYLKQKLPSLPVARTNHRKAELSLEDLWVLLRYGLTRQRPEITKPHFEAIKSLHGEHWGFQFIQLSYLTESRQFEELRTAIENLGKQLLENKGTQIGAMSLANAIQARANNLNVHEKLNVLKQLEPVWDSYEGKVIQAKHSWDKAYLGILNSLQRGKAIGEFLVQMLKKYPTDVSFVNSYTYHLVSFDSATNAIEFAKGILNNGTEWSQYEHQQLRTLIVNTHWANYKLEELVDVLESWIAKPKYTISGDEFGYLLRSLVYLDRETRANRYAHQWLELHKKDEELSQQEQHQLFQAIDYSIGYLYHLSHQYIEDEFLPPLHQVITKFWDQPEVQSYVGRILTSNQFRNSTISKEVYGELLDSFNKRIETMPVDSLTQAYQWLSNTESSLKQKLDWDEIKNRLFVLWDKTESRAEEYTLYNLIWQHGDHDLKMKLVNRKLEKVKTDRERIQLKTVKFDLLTSESYSEKTRDTFNTLLEELWKAEASLFGGEQNPDNYALQRKISFLVKFSNWHRSKYETFVMNKDKESPKLDRRQLREAKKKARLEAYAQTAAQLELLKPKSKLEELSNWVEVERLYFLIKSMKRDAGHALALKNIVDFIESQTAETQKEDQLITNILLADRCVTSLIYLDLLNMIKPVKENGKDEPIKGGEIFKFEDHVNERLAKKHPLFDWKYQAYRLRVVLNQEEKIEQGLKEWSEVAKEELDFEKTFWVKALAYFNAEKSRLEQAAALFKRLEAIDELSPSDVLKLADWQIALDQRENAEASVKRAFYLKNENELNQWIHSHNYTLPWPRGGVSKGFDPRVPWAYSMLLKKARNPNTYNWRLRSMYNSTKDFRVLACLADSLHGHSALNIYGILQTCNSIMERVNEEATCDRLVKRIDELLKSTEKEIDKRGLHYLLYLTETQASRQSQGGRDHMNRAIASLRLAIPDKLRRGEAKLLSDLLQVRRHNTPKELAKVKIELLNKVYRLSLGDLWARFHVGEKLAESYWNAQQKQKAIDTFEAMFEETRPHHDGSLPSNWLSPYRQYLSYLFSMGMVRKSNQVQLIEMSRKYPQATLDNMNYEYVRFRVRAFDAGRWIADQGKVEHEFDILSSLIREKMAQASNERNLRSIAQEFGRFFVIAHKKGFSNKPKEELKDFAYRILPRELQRFQYRQGNYVVGSIVNNLKDVHGYREGLEFMVTRLENEPRWLRLNNDTGWNRHHYTIARYRTKSHSIGNSLNVRLEKIVLNELQHELRYRIYGWRSIFNKGDRYYWSAKESEFIRVAHETALLRPHDEEYLISIARFLSDRIKNRKEAIKIVRAKLDRSGLSLDGKDYLADLYYDDHQHDEALPLYQELRKERPTRLQYRTRLLVSHYHVGNKDEVLVTYEEIIKDFKEKNNWNHSNASSVAFALKEARVFDKAIEHLDEAIKMYTRSRSNRGIGSHTLAHYYSELAKIHSSQGNTILAVDAASGAVITWGRNKRQRDYAVNTLRKVLRESKDILAYGEYVDKQALETGQEIPLIRKNLGQILQEKGHLKVARKNLEIAAEISPEDEDTHKLLIEVYKHMKLQKEAAAQILIASRVSKDPGSWLEKLGQMYTKLGQPQSAERAFTSILERRPGESKSHSSLATIRQTQNRWKEAKVLWKESIRLHSENPDGYLNLAKTLIQLADKEEAEEVLLKALNSKWIKKHNKQKKAMSKLLSSI